MELSFLEAKHPQGVRRIRKAAEPPTTAQQRGNPFPVSLPPCQGEMSRRDKRDREAQRADVAIRNPRPLAPLLKGAVSEADWGIPVLG